MSRLYLIFIFIWSVGTVFGQNLLPKHLQFADEQMKKGDYIYAIEHYQKAMDIDSSTIDILWKMAEAQRMYKDYRKAEYYYAKIYKLESSKIFPSCLLQLALMQKQNGKYDLAIENFKKAKKLYSSNKKDYLYIKAKHELESTIWAKDNQTTFEQYDMSRLPEPVNSVNAEFIHSIKDGQLYFSSLRGDSVSNKEEVYSLTYYNQLYHSDQQLKEVTPLFETSEHNGNGTFSLDGHRFYYSICTSNQGSFSCKIAVRTLRNHSWSEPEYLGEIINATDASNTTMPHIGRMDGKEILFFASNRKESEGGLDIFYSEIKNGQQFSKPRAIKSINSIEDEVTPYWDEHAKRLYFSSTWYNNFGGMDVFFSDYSGQFASPINAGQPINSTANDLYFITNQDTLYLSSNRMGVLFAKNPTCCTDIFRLQKPMVIIPPTPKETLAELNKRLPVILYFHNDEPNPKTQDTTTNLNYLTTYDQYLRLEETYKKEYQSGLKGEKAQFAAEDIEDFFMEHVQKGVKDLELFTGLLLEELKLGNALKVTVRGFASPLARTDYNVKLTKRRIASLVNYLREYASGVFIPYIESGKLTFEQIPFGEYNANQLISDNPNDQKQSVYSRAAALERKIEINSVLMEGDDHYQALELINPVYDAGLRKLGDQIEATFEWLNKSEEEIELQLEYKHPSLEAPSQLIISPKKHSKLLVKYNTEGFFGHSVRQVVYVNPKTKERFGLNITTLLQ